MASFQRRLRPVLGAFALAVLAAGCGGGGGGEEPEPEPTPSSARTRVQVLRDQALPRVAVTVDGVGGPAFLVGQRGPLNFDNGEGHLARIDTSTCTVTSRWSRLAEYLDAAKSNRIGLLHVELWTTWESVGLFPFVRDAAGRFRVQAAVENNEWNPEYFRTLRELVDGASARGIVVFLSLFNHYNIRIQTGPGGRPWSVEPLRAANTDTGFGLGDFNGDWKQRTAEFVTFHDAAGGLTTIARIQKALIERILEEIHQENVMFEPLMVPWIFNNPRMTGLKLAAWENWIISVIRDQERQLGRGFRAPIEVTPAPTQSVEAVVNGGVNRVFHIGDWQTAFRGGTAGYENWSEVDLIGYAGGFAFGSPPFGDGSIHYARERMLHHTRQFPDKVLLYSTDGFNQRYAPNRCTAALGEYVQDIRHGWWDLLDQGRDLSQYPLAWAQTAHDLTREVPLGSIHFLNWSTAQASMEDLGKRGF
jgi:hypothetical protein